MMNKFVISISLLISIITIVQAETPNSCATIKDDQKRLLCYDLIFRQSPPIITTESQWKMTQQTSKIDDSTNVFMLLDSAEPHRGPFGQIEKLQLMVFCRERKTSVFIEFAGEFMAEIQGHGRTTFRLDRNKAFELDLGVSTDNKALAMSGAEAIRFLKGLFGGANLFVRAVPFNASPVSGDFPVAGIEEAIKPLRAACGW